MKKVIRRGQVLCDNDGKLYLVIKLTDASVVCLDQTFEPIHIGLAHIRYYYDYDDDKDMKRIVEFVSDDGSPKDDYRINVVVPEKNNSEVQKDDKID